MMSSIYTSEKIASCPETIEEATPFIQIAGPLFLVFALALAGKTVPVFNYDLLAIAALGLFGSVRWRIRGCAYALALLGLSSMIKHLWIRDHHVFQAALEGSVGFSLLICALVYEQSFLFFGSLKQEIENRFQTIQSLEKDLTNHKEASVVENASLCEKLTTQQHLLEEVEADLAALQILNEVLRKSSASAVEEKSVLSAQMLQSQVQCGQLLEEIDLLQIELNRLGNKNELIKQNKELFQELNTARFKEAQTHLVNETLVRLHAQQNQRLKELEAEKEILIRETEVLRRDKEQFLKTIEDLQSQEQETLKIQELEVERIELLREMQDLKEAERGKEIAFQELQMQLSRTETEAKEWEQKAIALQGSTQGLQSLHQEQLSAIESVLETANISHKEQLKEMSLRLNQHENIELLYRQLKGQFEEKNKILHQTRSQLFHMDTELQTIKMQAQQKQLEADPLPFSICEELEEIEFENLSLHDENDHLQDLVTHLMKSAENGEKTVKKK